MSPISARSRRRVVLGSFVVALGLGLGAHAGGHPHQGLLKPYKGEPPKLKLTAKEKARLAGGKAVFKQAESESGGRGMAIQDLQAPPEVVWDRILAFGEYPKMIDNVKECEVYEKKGEHIKTRFVIGSFGISYEYFIDHVARPDQGYMTWTLDYSKESELHDSVGYWFVQPHPEKKGWTRLYYSVDILIDGWVPGFIQDMLRDKGLKEATRWVKLEAEKKARKQAAK